MNRTAVLPRTAVAAACAATAALGLAAAAAPAGASIVFVQDQNVWLANDDGSGRYQVTTDGTAENPWTSPSQADDGTIVAARRLPRSGPLYRMRQNGELLNRIELPAMQFGPFDAAVSPDGATVAYTHGFSRYVNGWLDTGTDIRYARADGSGGTEGWPGVSTGATTPSWTTAGTVVAGRGSVVFDQRPGQDAIQWWSDYDHQATFDSGADLSDAELAGDRVVAVRGLGTPNTLQVYRVSGRLGTPVPTCTVSDPADGPLGRRYADPTMSADGRRILWQEGDGIWAATTPAGDGCTGWNVAKLLDGASEPDWGPAPVNPGPRPAPAPAPAPVLGGPSSPAPAPAPAKPTAPARPAAPAKATRCAAAKKGAAREACVYRVAVEACAKTAKRRRASCLRAARRSRAVAVCQRTKKGAPLKVCLRRAKRTR